MQATDGKEKGGKERKARCVSVKMRFGKHVLLGS